MKDILLPIIIAKLKSLDETFHLEVLPRMEDNLQNFLSKLIGQGVLSENMLPKHQAEINEKTVKTIIQKEFQDALETKIVPQIEEILRQMLLSV